MSNLARELRHFASILWRDADKQADPDECRRIASSWHAQALIMECCSEMAGGQIDSVDDCSEMYGGPVDEESILTDLDLNNICTDPGDHLWLTDRATGETQCVHCGVPAMPVYASREA